MREFRSLQLEQSRTGDWKIPNAKSKQKLKVEETFINRDESNAVYNAKAERNCPFRLHKETFQASFESTDVIKRRKFLNFSFH